MKKLRNFILCLFLTSVPIFISAEMNQGDDVAKFVLELKSLLSESYDEQKVQEIIDHLSSVINTSEREQEVQKQLVDLRKELHMLQRDYACLATKNKKKSFGLSFTGTVCLLSLAINVFLVKKGIDAAVWMLTNYK